MTKKIILIVIGIALTVYVVWTCVLARQKSSEILRQFNEVEKSLGTPSNPTNTERKKTYSTENQLKIDALTKETKSLLLYIDNFKTTLYDKSKSGETLTVYLFEKKNASALKTELQNYKSFLSTNFPEQINNLTEKMNTDDSVQDGVKVDWEHAHFENMPLAAISSFLQKLQTEITDIEKVILDALN